jgi:hypothetical protein
MNSHQKALSSAIARHQTQRVTSNECAVIQGKPTRLANESAMKKPAKVQLPQRVQSIRSQSRMRSLLIGFFRRSLTKHTRGTLLDTTNGSRPDQ